ncbi:ABC transporter ATP-binding protein, partial [Halobacteriales archaeon QH_2_65_14]
REVSLGVRPEDLSVASEPLDSGHAVEGTVDTIEPLGEYTVVNVEVDGQLVKAKEASIDVDRGDRVYLTFDDRAAHLYDEEGSRLAR